MRSYEAMILVRPDLGDGDVQKVADLYKTMIEETGGSVESAAKWDKRKLAYEINNYKEANYVLFKFQAEAKLPAEFGRRLRNNDDVIRYRIFSIDD